MLSWARPWSVVARSWDDPAVDWVSLANGFGVEGAAVETAEGFHAVLEYALNRDGEGPFLIEAVMA